MDSCKKSAPKHTKTLQNYCCTSFSGYFTRHFFQLNGGLAARSWNQLGHLNNVRTVSQNRQAGQQKSCIEIAAIDASIDGWPIPSDAHRIQGFGQLPVAPFTLLHSPLNQQLSLETPFVHYLGLGFYVAGLGIKRQRASFTYTHFQRHDLLGYVDDQLKSILSHLISGYLYLRPNYFEVTINA